MAQAISAFILTSNRSQRTVFAEQSHERAIVIPDDIFDGLCVNLRDLSALLNVEQNCGVRRGEDQARSTSVENLAGLNRWLNGFYDCIR